MKTPLRTLALALVTASLLCSCASERVKEQARKEKANREGYVDYIPVGSNIPIKVPKDDPRVKASTDETDQTEAAFRNIQRSTQTPETGPQTGVPGKQGGGNGG